MIKTLLYIILCIFLSASLTSCSILDTNVSLEHKTKKQMKQDAKNILNFITLRGNE